MTHDNPTPLADSGELRAELIAMHPVTIATQGERRGLLGDETVEALAHLFAQHHQALLQKIEEAMPKQRDNVSEDILNIEQNYLNGFNRAVAEWENILNQAREGKL